MKTLNKIIYLFFAITVIVGNLGCNGDVFKSLMDSTDKDMLLLAGAQRISPNSWIKIRSITSTTPNGAYGVNTEINITVKFSGQVTLDGELMVTLDTGRTVNVSSPSYPAKELIGTYTVQRGDYSADLNCVAVALNSGTLRDNLDKDLIVELPTLRNRLAALKNIIADGRVPTITEVTSSSPNGLYKIDHDIKI